MSTRRSLVSSTTGCVVNDAAISFTSFSRRELFGVISFRLSLFVIRSRSFFFLFVFFLNLIWCHCRGGRTISTVTSEPRFQRWSSCAVFGDSPMRRVLSRADHAPQWYARAKNMNTSPGRMDQCFLFASFLLADSFGRSWLGTARSGAPRGG